MRSNGKKKLLMLMLTVTLLINNTGCKADKTPTNAQKPAVSTTSVTPTVTPTIPAKVDREKDTEDVLHYLAKQYLEKSFPGKTTSITDFRDAIFTKSGPARKQSATCDTGATIDGGNVQRFRLMYVKSRQGWEITSCLEPLQLYCAHPVVQADNAGEMVRTMRDIDRAAAVYAESEIRTKFKGDAIYSEHVESTFNDQSGFAVSKLSFKSDKTPDFTRLRYLLKYDGSQWKVSRSLTESQKVNFETGEVEE